MQHELIHADEDWRVYKTTDGRIYLLDPHDFRLPTYADSFSSVEDAMQMISRAKLFNSSWPPPGFTVSTVIVKARPVSYEVYDSNRIKLSEKKTREEALDEAWTLLKKTNPHAFGHPSI